MIHNYNKDLLALLNVILTKSVGIVAQEGEQGIGNELFMQVKNVYRKNG